ncbi:MAG: hypothetical protein R3C11_27230 [Planctomycetaceae bacterium]
MSPWFYEFAVGNGKKLWAGRMSIRSVPVLLFSIGPCVFGKKSQLLSSMANFVSALITAMEEQDWEALSNASLVSNLR